MKKVILTESDLRYMIESAMNKLIREGITYKSNGNGTIDASINSLQTDKANKEVDTRIWGSKNDVLYGDGTLGKRSKSVAQKQANLEAAKNGYLKIIELLNSGADEIDPAIVNDIEDAQSKSAFMKRIRDFNEGETTADDMLIWAKNSYDRINLDKEISQNKVDRFSALASDNDKDFRYDVGTVPETNVEFISLYRMNDFNFSDVTKHGQFRQNGLTDKLLGIKNSNDRSREDKLYGKGRGQLKRIPATYDNGLTPDVANNFSLNAATMAPDAEHYKKQYGLGDENYTSFTQFLDKSIIYAARVLKEVGYEPDVIIAPPSSSKYNKYYCTNLSRKLGIPYIDNFYERNVTEVRCDEEGMRNAGMTESNIFAFKTKVKSEVAAEISLIVAEPMVKLVNAHPEQFSNVRKGRGVNYDLSAIRTVLCQMSANALVQNLGAGNTDYLYKQICFKLANKDFGGGTIKNPEIERQINDIVHSRAIMREYQQALAEMHRLILAYEEKLMTEEGIKLNVASKKFKVTDFDKRERKFLSNVYVVASKNLNKNGELFNRLSNSNFLIFDEDMNSGATLKLSIDALLDKIPGHNSDQIKCLVNCYSSGGR
jgi:hypothetical protein